MTTREDKYQARLENAYNPRITMIIQSFRKVGEIVSEMQKEGYTLDQIYTICDSARATVGLPTIERKHTITNVTTGVDPARIQQNEPAFFVSWKDNGEQQYAFFACAPDMFRLAERLKG